MRLSLLNKVEAHQEGVWSATWVPGTNNLLTGSVDESVKVWEDTPNGLNAMHTYTGHVLGVIAVTVSSGGTFAATSAMDSYIRVWNMKTQSTVTVIETPPTETWAVAFGPGEDPLMMAAAGGSKGAVMQWRIGENSECIHQLALPQAEETKDKDKKRFTLSVAYSPDGKYLAAGAMDGTVALYDALEGRLVATLQGHHKPVRSLCFTPDSKMVLTACDDMHAHLYDAHNGALIEAFSGHESWVLSVSAHPSGTAFATGSSDSKVKLWDLNTRTCFQTLADHSDQVWAVAFNSDGTRLASASDDRQLAVYSVASQ